METQTMTQRVPAPTPDLSLSKETIAFLARILPNYEASPKISNVLKTNLFPSLEEVSGN